MKGEVCVGGSGGEAGGKVLLRSVINQSFKVKCSFSS